MNQPVKRYFNFSKVFNIKSFIIHKQNWIQSSEFVQKRSMQNLIMLGFLSRFY